jgi:multiple RNA-binding domain-containing protein 1
MAVAKSKSPLQGKHRHRQQQQSSNDATAVTSSSDLIVSQTRICIKNLPVSMVLESDLRNFLHQQLKDVVITDCKILKQPRNKNKSRRMAFVGFSSAAMASNAVELLHKSYCQSARLVVEFAQLPKLHNTNHTTTTTTTDPFLQNEDTDPSGPRTNNAESIILDQKKQEFLDAMGVSESQTTKHRKFWANDDGNVPLPAVPVMEDDAKPNDQTTTDHASSESSSSSDDDDDDVDPLQSSSSSAVAATKSAMDFLKSKQITTDNLDEDPATAASQQSRERETSATIESSNSSSSDTEENDVDTHVTDENHEVNESGQNEKNQEQDHDLSFESLNEMKDDFMPNRLFLRNLPFLATEEDIRSHLEPHGTITECHIPVDDQKHPKGFAFVTFEKAIQAQAAMSSLDGHDFQGRILHILPARKASTNNNDTESKHGSYKDQKEMARQREASQKSTGWSASFVRGDAVLDNLAIRLGLRKGDILSVKDSLSSGDAAVRLALGETAIIEENRKYFAEHGIDMEALVSLRKSEESKGEMDIPRSKTAFLVKNLPFDTTKDELLKIFSFKGESPSNILLPPSRTIAVVEYEHANDAKLAFRRTAYKRFKNVPLYLEWAPLASKLSIDTNSNEGRNNTPDENDVQEMDQELGPTAALYITNLNFSTSEDQLYDFFSKHVHDVRAVRIPKKVAAIKRKSGEETNDVKELSMGYGFVEFGSKESAREILKKLQGALLDGHALQIKPSSSKLSENFTKVKAEQKTSKLMVRNVPFQATRKELLQLFGSFGQLKKVRLPKKFDGSHRGFAFVEYLTNKEAAVAMKSLSRTHLYGRHLVIEWAAEDEEVEDLAVLREKAERDMAPKGKKIRFT